MLSRNIIRLAAPFIIMTASCLAEEDQTPGSLAADEITTDADLAAPAINAGTFTDRDNPLIIGISGPYGGSLDFIDESALGKPGDVGIVAFGSAIGLLNTDETADYVSPLELYLSLASEPAPELLLQNHAILAARGLVPAEPRASIRWRNEVLDFECGGPAWGPEEWYDWFNSWRTGYGTYIGTSKVSQINFYITSANTTQRALAICRTTPAGFTDPIQIRLEQRIGSYWTIFYLRNNVPVYDGVAYRSTTGYNRTYRMGAFNANQSLNSYHVGVAY